jgi:hypothetical protein
MLLGSKISPSAVEYLRLVKDFFGLEFSIKELGLDSAGGSSSSDAIDGLEKQILVSCVGVGLANLARRTF